MHVCRVSAAWHFRRKGQAPETVYPYPPDFFFFNYKPFLFDSTAQTVEVVDLRNIK